MNIDSKCPRCGAKTYAWNELSSEEQEVIRRLPGAADYSSERRRAVHRWCTRCWHEVTEDEPREA